MDINRHRRDEQLERLLGTLLRAGVLAAAAVVVVGGVLYLVRHGGEPPGLKTFYGEPAELRSLSGIMGSALEFDGRGVIMVGLLLVVATPIARVVFSIFGFLRERDFLYVALTLVVLAVLLYSLVFGQTL